MNFPIQINLIESKLKTSKNISTRSDVDIYIQFELKGVTLTEKVITVVH